MLVKPHEYMERALRGGYAVGAFNASNLEVTQAIIGAASQLQAPVYVQTSEGAIDYAGLRTLAGIVRTLVEDAECPVFLHLDHGKSLERVQACIEAGYTSVMIDASAKNFEENVRITREVVEYAHGRGVWVEAELGSILGKEGAVGLHGEPTPEALLTNPTQARQFVDETGVDALAVSVGTIHGAFTGQEYIRFELLEAIERALGDFPLVLHGASGIANKHIKQAVARSVCKVNVDTELRIAFEQAVRASLKEAPANSAGRHDSVDPREMLGAAREAVQAVVGQKIRLLGSAGMGEV